MLWYAALGGLDLVNYCKKLAIIPNRWSQDQSDFGRQTQAIRHHILLMPTAPDAHIESYVSILVSSEARLDDGVHLGVGIWLLLSLNRMLRRKKGPKWDAAIIKARLPVTPPRPQQRLSIWSIKGLSFIIRGCGALPGLREEPNMRAQFGTNRRFSGSWRKDTKYRTRCATTTFPPQQTHHNRVNDVLMG